MPHILLCLCGSVASITYPDLVSQFSLLGEVRVILTASALPFVCSFLDPNEIMEFDSDLQESTQQRKENAETHCWSMGMNRNGPLVYVDQYEWKQWKGKGDPIVHIEVCVYVWMKGK